MRFADSFRAARWVRFVNLLLQAVLFLTLFSGLNYIALNHHSRFDLTEKRRYSLYPETRSYLEQLARPVQVYVTLTENPDDRELDAAYRDISGLLREFAYASRSNDKGRIEVVFLDVFQSRKKAEELRIDQPNLVVLICGDHRRVLKLGDFYRTKDRKRDAFQGESTLTSALLDVTSAQKKKIYFLQGHGEIDLDDVSARGLSNLRDELRQRNFEVDALDLARTHKVPDDAALILSVGPQGRCSPFEEDLLRTYLQTRAGSLILLLDPMRQHGFENLTFEWGIIAYDNVIYDSNPEEQDESGNLILRRFAAHPITQNLLSNRLPILTGLARVVTEDRGRTADDGLNVKVLIATSDTAWGETSYRLKIPPVYTPGQDLRGQLGVFTVSERVKPANNLKLSVRGGRVAVFGTADLVTNNRLINPGNLNLCLATINWSTSERDTQLNIPYRPIERFQLTLSQEELGHLRLGLLALVPGAVALLGLLVYWTRRN